MDLATLIKPVLAAGELRVVGSTTFDEYKHIERDRGLARRLQKVVIEEAGVEEDRWRFSRGCGPGTRNIIG